MCAAACVRCHTHILTITYFALLGQPQTSGVWQFARSELFPTTAPGQPNKNLIFLGGKTIIMGSFQLKIDELTNLI